jgi:Cu+-exporting ATPase
LLSATYTNGNLLRIFSNNGLFLRDATVIEQLGNIDHIVFDKTGTLTQGSKTYSTSGHQLSAAEEAMVYSVAISSQHPHSVALCEILGPHTKIQPDNWVEIPGSGVKATIGKHTIRIGSAIFTGVVEDADNKANVYVRIDDEITAYYFLPDFRDAAVQVMPELRDMCKISLLSGDNNRQEADLRKLLGQESELLFSQKPVDKLTYIAQLQQNGTKVAMIGDGLNDAGALQQSNVGITLTDDINNFTPSCDAILDASRLAYLPPLLRLARSARSIINLSFIVSILYNIVGLYISVRGDMEPMIAAILMPVSTLSIILITTGASSIWARHLRLSLQAR